MDQLLQQTGPAGKTTPAYLKAYNNLNTYQKEAVQAIDGPVMVIAGPGTGKTEMLAVRVGHILLQPDVHPSNVLCLTFSNAGVASMKKRLKALMGGTGELVEVATFHGFCNKIIQQYGGEGNKARRLVTDAERYQVLEGLLCDKAIAGDLFSLKPPTSFRLRSLAAILADMKKQGLDKSTLGLLVNKEIEAVPFQEEYINKRNGSLKKNGQEAIDQLKSFRALGDIYEAYNRVLGEKGLVEYEDMLDAALDILRQDADLLLDYQERYQYILVDEFQDTNKKQLALLQQLIAGQARPNIFFVGDDDQCIYKFQGASKENIDWVQHHLDRTRMIELDSNYRSTQAILDLGGGFIDLNTGRGGLRKQKLKAANPAVTSAVSGISLTEYATTEHEAYHTCEKIRSLLGSGHDPSEIAVLYRKNSQAQVFLKWFRYFGIDHAAGSAKKDLLDTTEGKTFHYLLQYLALKEKDGQAAGDYLAGLLLHTGDKEEAIVLYQKYLAHKKEKETKGEGPVWFGPWLGDATLEKNKGLFDRVKACETLTATWNEPPNETSLDTLYSLLGWEAGEAVAEGWKKYLQEFISNDNEKSLAALADLLLYHVRYELRIEFDAPSETQGKVVLSTLHGSKGLEYRNVFIVGCTNAVWENAKEPPGGISVPKALKKHLNRLGDDKDDLRRLLYVGVTRGKAKLNLSCAVRSNAATPHRQSCFIGEIANVLKVPVTAAPEAVLPSLGHELYQVPASNPLYEFLKGKVSEYSFTASSLNSLIECESTFVLRDLLKLPTPPEESMCFGSALHDALETVFITYRSCRPTHAQLEEAWKVAMEELKLRFHPLHYAKYEAYGLQVLAAYIDKAWLPEAVVSYCEVWAAAQMDGYRLKGKIDRVDVQGGSLAVIDYKSGSTVRSLKPFVDRDDPGNDYWRQGAIYSMLVKQRYPGLASRSLSFHFIETYLDNEAIEKELNIGDIPQEWYTYLKELWARIQDMRFSGRCNKETCSYCDMADELLKEQRSMP